MKKLLFFSAIAIAFFLFIACSGAKKQGLVSNSSNNTNSTELMNPKLKNAYFASGCFWCVEAVYESVEGVLEVYSGYAGGKIENPTYRQVSAGATSHAEAVQVIYDPTVVSYATLLQVFFASGDPTTLNRQGPDAGTQYRSAIFYLDEKEQQQATSIIAQLEKEKVFKNPIVTEVTAFTNFYKAEDYHQNFERLNPDHGYVKSVSIPRLNRFKEKFPELLKK